MRLLLDEHYSKDIAEALRKLGHDVVTVTERSDLLGVAGADLLSTATREQQAIVTEDVRDFIHHARQLAASQDKHYGVILTSPSRFPRAASSIGLFVRSLSALLEQMPAEDTLVNQVRWLEPA